MGADKLAARLAACRDVEGFWAKRDISVSCEAIPLQITTRSGLLSVREPGLPPRRHFHVARDHTQVALISRLSVGCAELTVVASVSRNLPYLNLQFRFANEGPLVFQSATRTGVLVGTKVASTRDSMMIQRTVVQLEHPHYFLRADIKQFSKAAYPVLAPLSQLRNQLRCKRLWSSF